MTSLEEQLKVNRESLSWKSNRGFKLLAVAHGSVCKIQNIEHLLIETPDGWYIDVNHHGNVAFTRAVGPFAALEVAWTVFVMMRD